MEKKFIYIEISIVLDDLKLVCNLLELVGRQNIQENIETSVGLSFSRKILILFNIRIKIKKIIKGEKMFHLNFILNDLHEITGDRVFF
jgi:hypothetical protein